MALKSSGAISLNDIHIEAGGSSGTQASINDADIRTMINKSSGAQASFSEYYGASSSILTLNVNLGLIEQIGQLLVMITKETLIPLPQVIITI